MSEIPQLSEPFWKSANKEYRQCNTSEFRISIVHHNEMRIFFLTFKDFLKPVALELSLIIDIIGKLGESHS